jgi:hypothetical protein
VDLYFKTSEKECPHINQKDLQIFPSLLFSAVLVDETPTTGSHIDGALCADSSILRDGAILTA